MVMSRYLELQGDRATAKAGLILEYSVPDLRLGEGKPSV